MSSHSCLETTADRSADFLGRRGKNLMISTYEPSVSECGTQLRCRCGGWETTFFHDTTDTPLSVQENPGEPAGLFASLRTTIDAERGHIGHATRTIHSGATRLPRIVQVGLHIPQIDERFESGGGVSGVHCPPAHSIPRLGKTSHHGLLLLLLLLSFIRHSSLRISRGENNCEANNTTHAMVHELCNRQHREDVAQEVGPATMPVVSASPTHLDSSLCWVEHQRVPRGPALHWRQCTTVVKGGDGSR